MFSLRHLGCRAAIKAVSQPRRAYSQAIPPTNGRWLDELQAKLSSLKDKDISHRNHGRLSRKMRRIETGRLELMSAKEGYAADAASRGLDHVPVAWGEMDSMYNRWAEAGRINFLTSFVRHAEDDEQRAAWRALGTPSSVGVILSSIKTQYKSPITYPDTVSVIHRLASKPSEVSDRFTLEGIIFSNKTQRIAARTTEEIVVYNYFENRKTTLPPFMLRALTSLWHVQEHRRESIEAEIVQWRDLIHSIEQTVAAAEKKNPPRPKSQKH